MNNIYRHSEKGFEKLVSAATAILGNSVTFILALCLVIFWFSNKEFYKQDIHQSVGDVILGVTFLSLFIIQKSFNRFSGSLHYKVNELVASNESANNIVISAEGKTEHELIELSKEYSELAVQALAEIEEKADDKSADDKSADDKSADDKSADDKSADDKSADDKSADDLRANV